MHGNAECCWSGLADAVEGPSSGGICYVADMMSTASSSKEESFHRSKTLPCLREQSKMTALGKSRERSRINADYVMRLLSHVFEHVIPHCC